MKICRSFSLLILEIVVLIPLAIAASSERLPAGMQLIPEVQHDTSAPLADLQLMTPAQPMVFSPKVLNVLPTGPGSATAPTPLPDSVLQEEFMPLVGEIGRASCR